VIENETDSNAKRINELKCRKKNFSYENKVNSIFTKNIPSRVCALLNLQKKGKND